MTTHSGNRSSTLVELMACGESDAPAILASDTPAMTFGALRSLVQRTISTLNGYGIGRGDRVAIVLGGRLERLATVGELVNGQGSSVEVRIGDAPLLEMSKGWSGCLSLSGCTGESVLTLSDDSRLQELLAFLVQHRIPVRAVTPQRGTLEDLFMAAAQDAAIKVPAERRSA